VDEIVEMVRRDACFYRHSGGGVTIGGGEVLFQPAFTCELLRRCKEIRLNTAIETSGYGQWRWLERIARYCDIIFYDLKAIDRQRHMHMTGVGNELILANLTALDQLLGSGSFGLPPRLVLRVPVIPEQNADRGSMEAIGSFVSSRLHHVAGVELLPFHNLCEPKYAQLGRPYALNGRESATSEQVEPLQKVFTDLGVPCTIMSW
jgi:pyruvate formate lyase activating enzyme